MDEIGVDRIDRIGRRNLRANDYDTAAISGLRLVGYERPLKMWLELGELMPTLTSNTRFSNSYRKSMELNTDGKNGQIGFPDIGCPVDRNDEQTVEVEVFPDRPDLLSHETMSRASRSFLCLSEEGPDMAVTTGEISLTVDPELASVRPMLWEQLLEP